MEKLPKPLIALINSIMDEYDSFTWNSNYLGDKMRISLIWTRGELALINKGLKHKSKSCKERDSKRLKIWKDDVVTNSCVENSSNCVVEENIENHSVMEDIDLNSNDIDCESDMDSLDDTPQDLNAVPVVNKPVRLPIDLEHNRDLFKETKTVTSESLECRTIFVNKTQDPNVLDIKCRQLNETEIIAPRSIVNGKSPCTDSHFEKIVYSRTLGGALIIGRVKKRDIIVTRNISHGEQLWHVDKAKNDYHYTELAYCVSKYKDVRKMTKAEYNKNVCEIPDMERYVEKFRLCPYCFE